MLFVQNVLALVQVVTTVAALARAEPIGLAKRNIPCSQITNVVNDCKKLGILGTIFCSAYLHIPATTTGTATVIPTVTTTSTTTVTIDCGAGKRAVDSIQERGLVIPPLLSKYAAATLSAACSCLGLHPKATVSATITGAPTTTTVVSTESVCSTDTPNCLPLNSLCTGDGGLGIPCCGDAVCQIDTTDPDTPFRCVAPAPAT